MRFNKLISSEALTGLLRGSVSAVAAAAVFTASVAAAQDTAASSPTTASDTDTYTADFFDQYTPQNAFDMIERLPGFSFNRGSDARGFGGTAGNVLIDGSRPTSKSVGLEGLLKRIPAAQVLRIEILRGGVGAGEAAGQSVVANVIRIQGGSSGTWTGKLRLAPDGRVRGNAEASLSSTIGAWDTSFDFDIGQFAGNGETEVRDFDADGVLTSSGSERRPRGGTFGNVNASGSRDFAGGKLSLNGRLAGNEFEGRATRFTFFDRLPDDNLADSRRFIVSNSEGRDAEFGADWVRTYANTWKWRLLGLGVYEKDTFTNPVRTEDYLLDTVETSEFIQDSTNTEFVLRTTYGKTGSSKIKPEFGVEVAKNKLDTSAVFFVDGVLDQALEGTDVIVSELRGEAFANFVYQATPKLTLDGGLTAEVSNIKVRGENPNSRTLKFLKPRLTGTYSFSDNIQLTIEAERRVGQLNFGAFASSTQADDDLTTSGNTELEPEKQSRLEATLDWKFGTRGSVKIRALQQWRSDVLEQIELEGGGNGLGNAGNAKFFRLAVNLDLPLDGFIKGGLLEVGYRLRSSSFRDAIIGGDIRNVNGFRPNNASVSFRQDLTDLKLSWGFSYFAASNRSGFRVDELQPSRNGAEVEAFIETTRYFGVKMRLEVENLNTPTSDRTRLIFENNRSGDFLQSQTTQGRDRPRVRFEVSGTF